MQAQCPDMGTILKGWNDLDWVGRRMTGFEWLRGKADVKRTFLTRKIAARQTGLHVQTDQFCAIRSAVCNAATRQRIATDRLREFRSGS